MTHYIDKDISLEENSFQEIFNYDKLKYIVENKELFSTIIKCDDKDKDPFALAEKYLEFASKIVSYKQVGWIDVRYRYAKDDESQMGRLYAKNSLSLQSMPKAIRNTIAHEYYWDLDMVNAHPTIIKWLCDKYQISCKCLTQYVEDRDKVINELTAINDDLSYDKAKQVILATIYGGDRDYELIENKTKWLKRFHSEMEDVHDSICKEFPDIYEMRRKIKKINVKSSTLSYIATIYENKILHKIMAYLKDKMKPKHYKQTVLCFDGLMIRRTIKEEAMSECMADLEKIILEDMGVPIKLKIKEMKPMDLPNFSPYELYSYDDEYYWNNFILKLTGKIWEWNDLNAFIKKNINRVLIRLSTGEYFLKLSKKDTLAEAKRLPIDLIRIKNDEKPIKPISLRNLIESKYLNDIKIYNGFSFNPRDMDDECENGYFNTWSGFQAGLVNGVNMEEIQLILDHIKIVWAAGNDEYNRYILSWLHQLFKYPWNKTRVVLALRSEKQQIGKGIIVEKFLIPLIFGQNSSLYDTGLDGLVCRFNHHLMNKVFVCIDELSTISTGYHNAFDKIKSMITSETTSIEIKGSKKFSVNNFMNFIFLTNNTFSLRVEGSDMRYAAFDCSNEKQGDYAYFDKLAKCFTQRVADMFFTYIYNLEDTVDIRNIPDTELRKVMRFDSTSSPRRLMMQVKEIIEFKDDEDIEYDSNWKRRVHNADGTMSATQLYSVYKEFCDEEGDKKPFTQTRFGREIRDVIEKKKTKECDVYILDTIKINA